MPGRKLRWYVSFKSADGTELGCMTRSAWRRSGKLSTSGSELVVAGEFLVATWQDAMQSHYDLHGLGRYAPP